MRIVVGFSLCIGLAAGCTALAGLDGEYVVGEAGPGSGGSGAGGMTMASGGSGATMASSTSGQGGSGGATTGGAGPTSTGVGGSGGGMGGNGGMKPTFQVPCNNGLCAVGEVCCVGSSNNDKAGCAMSGNCQSGTFAVSCDGPEDCEGGDVCCGVYNGAWMQISCESSCSNYQAGERVICGNNSSNCPMSNPSCIQSGSLPGYYWCS